VPARRSLRLWFARALAWRTAPTLLRAGPMVVFAMFLLPALGHDEWRLVVPELANGLAFLASFACALALACAMSTLLHVTMLWTISGDGVVMMASAAVAMLSGLIVPLPLLPDWAQSTLAWLPFAGLVDHPYRLYSGALSLDELPLVLARQLGWTLALVALGRFMLARAIRRIVVQGG
jgi:ABC-2 type transport system permease protein